MSKVSRRQYHILTCIHCICEIIVHIYNSDEFSFKCMNFIGYLRDQIIDKYNLFCFSILNIQYLNNNCHLHICMCFPISPFCSFYIFYELNKCFISLFHKHDTLGLKYRLKFGLIHSYHTICLSTEECRSAVLSYWQGHYTLGTYTLKEPPNSAFASSACDGSTITTSYYSHTSMDYQ